MFKKKVFIIIVNIVIYVCVYRCDGKYEIFYI